MWRAYSYKNKFVHCTVSCNRQSRVNIKKILYTGYADRIEKLSEKKLRKLLYIRVYDIQDRLLRFLDRISRCLVDHDELRLFEWPSWFHDLGHLIWV